MTWVIWITMPCIGIVGWVVYNRVTMVWRNVKDKIVDWNNFGRIYNRKYICDRWVMDLYSVLLSILMFYVGINYFCFWFKFSKPRCFLLLVVVLYFVFFFCCLPFLLFYALCLLLLCFLFRLPPLMFELFC